MAMDKENEVKRVVVTTHSEVRINGKIRKGLISTTTEKFVSTRDGVDGEFDSLRAAAKYYESLPKIPIKEYLNEQIEELEHHAQAIAKREGCLRNSTLDVIELDVVENGKSIGGSTRQAGSDAIKDSLFHAAYMLERQISDFRKAIRAFEESSTCETNQELFYNTLSKAISIARKMWLITTQRYEKEILRGLEKNYTHPAATGNATEREQKSAVRRIEEMVSNELSQNAAIEVICKETGKSRSAVFGWLKNHRSSKPKS